MEIDTVGKVSGCETKMILVWLRLQFGFCYDSILLRGTGYGKNIDQECKDL